MAPVFDGGMEHGACHNRGGRRERFAWWCHRCAWACGWVELTYSRKSGDDRGDRQVVLERQSSVYIVDFYACLVWHTTRPPRSQPSSEAERARRPGSISRVAVARRLCALRLSLITVISRSGLRLPNGCTQEGGGEPTRASSVATLGVPRVRVSVLRSIDWSAHPHIDVEKYTAALPKLRAASCTACPCSVLLRY